MEFKYLVLKTEDIDDALSDSGKARLDEICEAVSQYRKTDGKGENAYLVLNIEEDYTGEVYALMFKHGHTPCSDCRPQNPKTCSNEYCRFLPVLIKAHPLIFPVEDNS